MKVQGNVNNTASDYLNQSKDIVDMGNTVKDEFDCFVRIEGEYTDFLFILKNIVQNVKEIYSGRPKKSVLLREAGNTK